jgi:hypothetical protein
LDFEMGTPSPPSSPRSLSGFPMSGRSTPDSELLAE